MHIHDPKERKRIDALLTPPRRDATGEFIPDWWKGEAEAAQSSLAVARAFGINVDLANVSG
jgi:hypothetical protein